MSIYINATGTISPQPTTDNSRFLEEIVAVETNRFRAIDPGYKDYIPADLIRRMGRIIKMGVAASKICLKEAGNEAPEAIITGTGLGCIEDTEKFLGTMIRNKEEFLTPTSFIQSTHNTVGAQIALLLKCHGYNFAYVHRGLSFESALTDAMMRLENGHEKNVLVGGIDELTEHSFAIMQRLGHWRRRPVNPGSLPEDHSRGTIAGEGASFFFLEKEKKNGTYAEILDVSMFSFPRDHSETGEKILSFLQKNGLKPKDIDLVITGMNGDQGCDEVYRHVTNEHFSGNAQALFKNLCGEYMTATAFGMWLGSKIIRHRIIPPAVLLSGSPSKTEQILLWNHYRHSHHSLILLSRA